MNSARHGVVRLGLAIALASGALPGCGDGGDSVKAPAPDAGAGTMQATPAPPSARTRVRLAEPDAVPGAVDPTALDPQVRAHLERLAASVEGARNDGIAWLALADALLAHGEPAGAAVAYAGAAAHLPDDAPDLERAEYLRAVALGDAGDSDAALAALAPVAAQSRVSQVRWRHALFLAGAGELEPAIAEARAAVALDPRDTRAHAALAQIASESGDWSTAEAAARDGLRTNPRNGHLYGILAAALRAQDRAAEAESLIGAGRFTRADWLDPWLRALRDQRLGKGAAQERFYEALRSGDAARAGAMLDAYAAATNAPDAAAADSRLPLMRAQLALGTNDFPLAAKYIEEAAALGANACDATIVRAAIAARQASGPAALDAVVAMLDALGCDGDAESTRLELVGNIRLAQQRWSDAATALAGADEARPGGVGPSLRKAIGTMDKAGAYADARRLAERLRDAEPLNPEAHLLVAVVSVHAGDLATARTAAAEAARIAPNHPALRKVMNDIQQASR